MSLSESYFLITFRGFHRCAQQIWVELSIVQIVCYQLWCQSSACFEVFGDILEKAPHPKPVFKEVMNGELATETHQNSYP